MANIGHGHNNKTALDNTSGTNTGDNATNSQYSGLVTNATHDGDATGSGTLTVVKINGTQLSGLATGILKNTTGTGVPSIAANTDLPAMSSTVGGAVPTPPNNTRTYLRGDATFAAPGLRVQSVSDAATVTPNCDTDDCVDITAIAQALTIANPSGTPVNFQKLIIRIKDNGTARAITFGTGYAAGGVALPTTTVLSKILTLGFQYNTANSLNKWQLIASAQEA